MNPNIPLELFLPPAEASDVHILLTKDWNGMNAGVFPIRVNEWSAELLAAAVGIQRTNPDVKLPWFDQSALVELFERSDYFGKSVEYYPLRWFNAYMSTPDAKGFNPDSPRELQVHPGDFLVHFPGTPKTKLNETLNPYLSIAEAHLPEWEVPLDQTWHQKDIAEFWSAKLRSDGN